MLCRLFSCDYYFKNYLQKNRNFLENFEKAKNDHLLVLLR